MDRFSRFDEQARHVLEIAEGERKRHNHRYIGPEHLLSGILEEHDGLADKVLVNLGLDLHNLQQDVNELIQSRIGLPQRAKRYVPTLIKLARLLVARNKLRLTQRSIRIIELAAEEARHLNHSSIGTEHLLIGILREGESTTGKMLIGKGLSVEQVRAEVVRILGQAPDEGHSNTDSGGQ